MATRLVIAWLLIALLGSGALVVVWRVATRNAFLLKAELGKGAEDEE